MERDSKEAFIDVTWTETKKLGLEAIAIRNKDTRKGRKVQYTVAAFRLEAIAIRCNRHRHCSVRMLKSSGR